jgi:hypothetical protein
MDEIALVLKEHAEVTRRFFFGLGAAGTAAWEGLAAAPADPASAALLASAASRLEYLTPLAGIKPLERGNPPPSQLSAEELPAAGLTRETWFLEVVPDAEGNPRPEVSRPLSREQGTAFDWKGLMKLAEKHAVRYLHVCTCTNVADPFHMTLWEGVPLREVIWMAGPKANVRRVYYWGHTTPNSKRFQSSLPLDRILEDPPGELPVILAYKMNAQEIPVRLGGPVRMVVPGSYGNRSIKWLQHIVLTNSFQANDTYAEANNDIESRIKTQARFIQAPKELPALKPAAVTGLAQVGASGLSRVEYCVLPESERPEAGDSLLLNVAWKPATILPPPQAWGAGVASLPAVPLQFDPGTGQARNWPMRYAIVHWAALLPGLRAGNYTLCCRSIDGNGIAQPMPRPLPRTGVNAIQRVALRVSA